MRGAEAVIRKELAHLLDVLHVVGARHQLVRIAVLKRGERAQVAAEAVLGHELVVAPEVIEDLTRSDFARFEQLLDILGLDCPLQVENEAVRVGVLHPAPPLKRPPDRVEDLVAPAVEASDVTLALVDLVAAAPRRELLGINRRPSVTLAKTGRWRQRAGALWWWRRRRAWSQLRPDPSGALRSAHVLLPRM